MKLTTISRTRAGFCAALFAAMTLTACGEPSVPPTVTPTAPPPTPTLEPTARPEAIAAGKDAFVRIGCVACHEVKGLSDQALAAPSLDHAYQLVNDILKSPDYKKSGGKAKTPREYVIESIMEPDAYTYPTCPQGPCVKGTMPTNYKDIIRPEELNNLVDYVLSLGR